MAELTDNELIFRFPDVHEHAVCKINFQRTLRIPDDNNDHPLPPGLGRFHLEHLEDHAGKVSGSMAKRGGIMLPMYQSEAMWINFSSGPGAYPFAIKIAAGKINAVNGEAWRESLTEGPQDYVVIPEQPWLDGFCVQAGLIRQFVAMPLGQGYTAEEQLTGAAEFGGLQIMAYPMKRKRYEALQRQTSRHFEEPQMTYNLDIDCDAEECASMGFAPGGLMRQAIYDDDYGIDAWDTSRSSRCFVHVLNSEQWSQITGLATPGTPPSAIDYANAGLPWFEYYNDKLTPLQGSSKLAKLDSLATKTLKNGQSPIKDNHLPCKPETIDLPAALGNQIRDGDWD